MTGHGQPLDIFRKHLGSLTLSKSRCTEISELWMRDFDCPHRSRKRTWQVCNLPQARCRAEPFPRCSPARAPGLRLPHPSLALAKPSGCACLVPLFLTCHHGPMHHWPRQSVHRRPRNAYGIPASLTSVAILIVRFHAHSCPFLGHGYVSRQHFPCEVILSCSSVFITFCR